MSLRVISYGGGVQSTALLALAATGRIDFRTFLFANVGDDSEDPATLAYIAEHAKPYAAAHNIELHELRRVKRDGTVETLHGRLTKTGTRTIDIPMRMSRDATGNPVCPPDSPNGCSAGPTATSQAFPACAATTNSA